MDQQQYERTIGLKTIWTTIVRRWYVFFMIFIPIALISYLVTDKMLTKTYISSVTLNRGSVIAQSYYSAVQSYFQDSTSDPNKPGAIYTTVEKLKNNDIKHSNGKEITAEEIKSGLSFSSSINISTYITVSYQNTDSTITQTILKELSETSVEYIVERAGTEFKTLVISSPANTPTKNSKERTYFLVALAAGFVVAFGIPFVDEIVSDEVYDKYDIEALGCSAFEVKAKPKKKEA